MEKLILKTLLFIIIFVPLSESKAKKPILNIDRNVIWIHGLDGDESSWSHYEQIFSQERAMNSLRKAYNSGNGLNNASYQVRSQIDTHLGVSATNSRNLAIGHSMGGLVARNLDRILNNNSRRFGGIITVASPNNGAYIANSLQNGTLEAAAENAYQKLYAGFHAQGIAATTTFPSVTGAINYLLTPRKLADLLLWYFDLNNAFGTETTNNDLKVGSSIIRANNNYTSAIPRISMWAKESSPVHWRLLSSLMNQENGLPPNDETFVGYMNNVSAYYNDKYNFYNTAAIVAGMAGNWWAHGNALFIANQWNKGKIWLDNSEAIWTTLIKSYKVETFSTTHTVLLCDLPFAEFDDGYNFGHGDDGGSNCKWITYTLTHSYIVMLPSDGLVSVEAQKINGLPSGNYYEILNANHFSVKNMSYKAQGGDNTYKEFDKIWKREDWFKTNSR
jgi:pimeloyl-ACP methyl ester carboxylesterase